MEAILEKANELGLMIKGTDLYRRFEELSKRLDADAEAKGLLEEYAKFSDELHEKEKSGGAIEVHEKQRLQEFAEKVSGNQLIKEYIATQTYFMNLMMHVQRAISEPKGDPITPSKIVTPGSGSNKIITDF